MHHVNVQRNFPPENKILQIKIHADSRGGQPHGLADVDRHDSLLHVAGVEIETTGDFQNIQQFDYQPVHHILPIQPKSLEFIKETQRKKIPE